MTVPVPTRGAPGDSPWTRPQDIGQLRAVPRAPQGPDAVGRRSRRRLERPHRPHRPRILVSAEASSGSCSRLGLRPVVSPKWPYFGSRTPLCPRRLLGCTSIDRPRQATLRTLPAGPDQHPPSQGPQAVGPGSPRSDSSVRPDRRAVLHSTSRSPSRSTSRSTAVANDDVPGGAATVRPCADQQKESLHHVPPTHTGWHQPRRAPRQPRRAPRARAAQRHDPASAG
jgi:hypothetical protein